jgi:lysozyme family protein
MRENWRRALAFVLRWEGGLAVDHAGMTYKGITQATYDAYRDRQGLYRRPVKYATDTEIETIYRSQYWDAMGCDDLPTGVDIVAFDGAVQHGVANMRRFLQESRTVLPGERPDVIALWLIERRRKFYRAIAARRPQLAKYLKGWLNRMDDLEREAQDAITSGMA